MMRKTKRSGFTLLELLVVVIIIGVLAAIAIPQFAKMTKKARAAEAVTTIGSYLTAEWAYYQENNKFDAAKANLLVNEPGTGNFTYSATVAAAAADGSTVAKTTVTATGVAIGTRTAAGAADCANISVTGTIDSTGGKTVTTSIS